MFLFSALRSRPGVLVAAARHWPAQSALAPQPLAAARCLDIVNRSNLAKRCQTADSPAGQIRPPRRRTTRPFATFPCRSPAGHGVHRSVLPSRRRARRGMAGGALVALNHRGTEAQRNEGACAGEARAEIRTLRAPAFPSLRLRFPMAPLLCVSVSLWFEAAGHRPAGPPPSPAGTSRCAWGRSLVFCPSRRRGRRCSWCPPAESHCLAGGAGSKMTPFDKGPAA